MAPKCPIICLCVEDIEFAETVEIWATCSIPMRSACSLANDQLTECHDTGPEPLVDKPVVHTDS